MYRIDRMRRDYERFTAAEGYAIGFHVGDDVYCAFINSIPRRYCRVQREGKRGNYGLYIDVSSKKKKNELIRRGAVKVGKISDLKDEKYNRGVMFEKMVYEMSDQVFRGKDSVPFHKSGDITINGVEIQVKYEHARICYNSTLTKLKKSA